MSIGASRLKRANNKIDQSDRILWGAWMSGLPYGAGYGTAPWSANTWNQFEANAGKTVSLMHYGLGGWWTEPFPAWVADLCTARGAYPFIDMMADDTVTLASILAGDHDASLVTWARAVRDWGKPMFFRWSAEMNGSWHSYSNEEIATPGIYAQSWRHIKDITDAEGATNLTWMWCPNIEYGGQISMAQVYPGDAYVDWTALDGYNWGTGSAGFTWMSWYDTFKESYDLLLTLAPGKPIMIAETGSNEDGGSKADWITDAFLTQIPNNFPEIRGVAWFNWPVYESNVTRQWPIESSPEAQAAFAAAIQLPYYQAGSMALPYLNDTNRRKITPL